MTIDKGLFGHQGDDIKQLRKEVDQLKMHASNAVKPGNGITTTPLHMWEGTVWDSIREAMAETKKGAASTNELLKVYRERDDARLEVDLLRESLEKCTEEREAAEDEVVTHFAALEDARKERDHLGESLAKAASEAMANAAARDEARKERDNILLSHDFAAEQANKWAERAERAEAELAALKNRPCDTISEACDALAGCYDSKHIASWLRKVADKLEAK